MKLLDLVGSLCDFSDTVLFARLSPWAWPLALLAVSLNAALFLRSGLYGDAMLQAVFCVSTLAGWLYWYSGKGSLDRPITQMSFWALGVYVLFAFPVVFLLHECLLRTSSTMAWGDSVTTTLSLFAEWLLCRKVLENWYFWFLADVIYVFLFAKRGLWVHSLESFLYLGLVAFGYYQWRKQLMGQLKTAAF